MTAINFTNRAQRIADTIKRQLQPHSSISWFNDDGTIFVVGNSDISGDEDAKREVEKFRRKFKELGGEELAFATDKRGPLWSLMVHCPHVDVEGFVEKFMDAVGGMKGLPKKRT